MTRVVIDMTMSLDGFVAGPGDGKDYPLGKNDDMRIFDWYFSGKDQYRHKLFRPEPGASLDQVKLMYEESGVRRNPDPSRAPPARGRHTALRSFGRSGAAREDLGR